MGQLEDCKKKAQAQKEYRNTWMRENYALAKELGLSSELAKIVSQKSKKVIHEVAREYADENKKLGEVSALQEQKSSLD